MVGCLVISHGRIAQAFIDACKQITGNNECLYSIDCNQLTPKALYREIADLIEREKLHDGLLILVCLRGGSCWNVAAKIANEYPNVEVMSGLNLSFLLSFITKKEKYPFHQLKDIVFQDGFRGMTRMELE